MSSFKVLFANRVVLPDAAGPKGALRVVPAAIGVDGARIVAVEEVDEDDFLEMNFTHPAILAAKSDGIELLDFSDHVLCPAFVNAHTHLAMCAFRGIGGLAAQKGNVVEDLFYKLEQNLSADDVKAFTRMGAFESVLCGTGVVWDHYYYGQAVADALVEVGLCGVVAPTLQDEGGPGAVWLDQQVHDTEALLASTYADNGVVAAVGAHATDTVSPSLWRRVSQLASQHNLPIHAHVAQSIEEVERSHERHGKSPVAYLHDVGALDGGSGFLLVHGLFISDDDKKLLHPSRHTLGYCPHSQVQFGFPTGAHPFQQDGIPVVVGTDAGACNDTMNVQQELRLVAGGPSFGVTASASMATFAKSGALDDAKQVWAERNADFDRREQVRAPEQLLRLVWDAPGQLHPAQSSGVLAEGALANILVVDPDHPGLWPATDVVHALCYGDVASALYGVMVGGKFIGERGDFHRSIRDSEAYMAAWAEAQHRLRALEQKIGLG